MLSHVVETIVPLLVIIVQIGGQRQMSTCGRLGPTVIDRIFAGHDTHRYPWHASIYHHENKALDPIYQCGGTLISSKAILTAAHCVLPNENNLLVSLGKHNLNEKESSTTQTLKVKKIFVHPEFESVNFKEDIAILMLSAEATLNFFVQPICLWKSNRVDTSEIIGKNGTVIGWGLTEKYELSNRLKEAILPVVSWSLCLQSNPSSFGSLLSDRNYCAGLLNGTGVCKGDSGGSMTFEENGIYYIRGIVSVSASKPNSTTQQIECDTYQYALFTDVAHYLKWIIDTAAITPQCEAKVHCEYGIGNTSCFIEVQRSDQSCKIIFDEVPNAAVTRLSLGGEFDVVPDLFDAAAKFQNLEDLDLYDVKLRIVERFQVACFNKHLKRLYLHQNELKELEVGTFDDLKKLAVLTLGTNMLEELPKDIFKELQSLEHLDLSNNQLKEVHFDLFNTLTNLKIIYLFENQLETIPRGLLRNNRKLTHIDLENNKIKKIEFHYQNMPWANLVAVNLEGNVCINEKCYADSACFNEIIENIQKNCRS